MGGDSGLLEQHTLNNFYDHYRIVPAWRVERDREREEAGKEREIKLHEAILLVFKLN